MVNTLLVSATPIVHCVSVLVFQFSLLFERGVKHSVMYNYFVQCAVLFNAGLSLLKAQNCTKCVMMHFCELGGHFSCILC